MGYFWNLLKNIDKALLFIPVVFGIISVIMVGSTAYTDTFNVNKDIKVQITAFILGFIAVGFILIFDYKIFETLDKHIYAVSVVLLLLVYVPGLGVTHFGARGWINLGVIDLQTSELVKITFVMLLASYLTRHQKDLDSFKGLVKIGLYALPLIGMILIQPDLGNALVLCVIAAVMVFFAGVDLKLYGKIALAGVISIPIMYRFMADHQKIRIDAFLHPENLSLPGNYQVWNSKVAIGSGGLSGKGLFAGTQKELKFLPVQKSDFIFSVIVEELGFIGGASIIALYTIFLYRIARIASNAKDMYGSLIVVGLLAMFFFQIFENIAMTMGLMPVTGVTLPFISYGGSSVVTNMIAIGMILNVGIRSKVINF